VLVQTFEDEGQMAAATARAIVAAVKVLADKNAKLEDEKRRHGEHIQSFRRKVSKAERETARVADAMMRLVNALEDGRPTKAAVRRAKTMAAGLGKEPNVQAFGLAMDALRIMVLQSAWGAITMAKEVPGNPGVVRGDIVVTWNGTPRNERHPRDLARNIMRELFDIDPDNPRPEVDFFDEED
jgi:hypothetical protein